MKDLRQIAQNQKLKAKQKLHEQAQQPLVKEEQEVIYVADESELDPIEVESDPINKDPLSKSK